MYISDRTLSPGFHNDEQDGERDGFEPPHFGSLSPTVSTSSISLSPSQKSWSNSVLTSRSTPNTSAASTIRPRSGVIIGATFASIIVFILILMIIDIVFLSKRIQATLKSSFVTHPTSYPPEAKALPLAADLRTKSLPPPPIFSYNKELERSRTLSLDSGYSSRYSRSTWGWSGGGAGGRTLRHSDEWLRKSADMEYYSVFEEDKLDEWEEKRGSEYKGKIKPGMGVQRRYTASSIGTEELGIGNDREDKHERKRFSIKIKAEDVYRRFWHPLSGKRGDAFARIGYY